jgi:glutamate-1-semialdehyde 2,1-aminomutase
VPRQQPFFSFDDWFIGVTEVSRGVPAEHSSLTLQFDYNEIDSLQKLFDTHPDEIAAVILGPASHLIPCSILCDKKDDLIQSCFSCPNKEDNFLRKVRTLCDKYNAVLIFDEMRTGFRWSLGGAQEIFGVMPDLSTFGKAIANGFSLSALVGKQSLMDLAGINKLGFERTFILSSTHGAEMGSLAAFLATTEICQREDVSKHLWQYGHKLKDMFNSMSKQLGISDKIFATGPDVSFEIITLDSNNVASLAFKTLFLQEMCRNKVLMTFVAPSYSHKEIEFEKTASAVSKSLLVYCNALNSGLNHFLNSELVKPVFRKYN